MNLRKSKKERIDRYIWLLNQYCFSGDIDFNHEMADSLLADLLKDLGYEEVVSVYKKVDKWYAKSL